MHSKTLVIACLLVILARLGASAQQTGTMTVPDITGSWERYGSFGRGTGAQKDPLVPPQAPPPPLRPEYYKEWQAKVQAAREADAKGEPLATGEARVH